MFQIYHSRFFQHLTLLLFLAGLTACNQSAPATYERVERYENGQISRRSNLVNGLKEGKMTDYYNDGKLMAERYFEHGQQKGRTLIYYPNGQIKEVQYFEAGKKQNGDTLWYEDGKIQFVTAFKDDKKNGYLRKWDPSGQLIYESKYSMDTLVEVKGQAIDRNSPAAMPSQVIKRRE